MGGNGVNHAPEIPEGMCFVTESQCKERREACEKACYMARSGVEKRITAMDDSISTAFNKIDKISARIDEMYKIAVAQLIALVLMLGGVGLAFVMGKF